MEPGRASGHTTDQPCQGLLCLWFASLARRVRRESREGWWVLLGCWHWNRELCQTLAGTFLFRHQCPLYLSCYWAFCKWTRKRWPNSLDICSEQSDRECPSRMELWRSCDPDSLFYRWRHWKSRSKILTQMFTNRHRPGVFWSLRWINSVKGSLWTLDLAERWARVSGTLQGHWRRHFGGQRN